MLRTATFVLLFALAGTPAGAKRFAPGVVAQVISSDGFTSLEPSHTNLVPGTELGEGDRITVATKSTLRLRLAQGAVVEVGPDSEVHLKKGDDGPLLRMPHGRLLVVSRSPSPLELRTGQVRFHVKAKAIFLEQRQDKPAFVSVREGKAQAKWRSGAAELEGKAEEAPVLLYPTKASPVPAKEDTEGHSEIDVEALRRLQ